MNPEVSGQESQTRWGIRMDRDLQAGLLEYLRGCVTPQRSKDIASAFKRHLVVVEQHLDLLAEAKLVRYRPIEGAVGLGRRSCPAGSCPGGQHRLDPW